MAARRLLPLVGVFLISGCLNHVRERTDQVALDLATHPFDQAPLTAGPAPASDRPQTLPMPGQEKGASGIRVPPDFDIHTTGWLQGKDGRSVKDLLPPSLNIPSSLPGAEAGLIKLPADKKKLAEEVRRLYPPLAELTDYPRGGPGPEGRPYTLTDLHRLAAGNSPAVRQAVADLESAKGNLIQANTYNNPTVGYEIDPSNNGSTAGVQGVWIDQVIKTGGKMKLQTAAALKDVDNAELALKRARSDLATQVRGAYFTFLVAREAVEVTRALATFTDEIYRLQANLLTAGFAAAYEPASLRAQAAGARLAYRQAIETYTYAWKQLAAAVGVRDLPLAEVAGRADLPLPQFDYNLVLAHVLRRHTDVLSAVNTVEKARYNLKLAQVTPVPDVDVRLAVLKETAVTPFNWVHTLQVGIPLPIWDQNKGAIIAAEAALARAAQEPKRVELTLVNGVATAFASYRTQREALEAYRREILPDQVRVYRGVFERRQIDPSAGFGDLVAAQATLAQSVTVYLTTLAQVWSSVVTLSDFLQTDDLFQIGQTAPLPGLTPPAPPAPPACAAPAVNAPPPRPVSPAGELPPPLAGVPLPPISTSKSGAH